MRNEKLAIIPPKMEFQTMKKKILLNGAGRIGKAITRLVQKNENLEIIAINDINPSIESIAYSINYDSTYGRIDEMFEAGDGYIQNSLHRIKVTHHHSLRDADLRDIDIIIDASGSKQDPDMLRGLDVDKVFLTHPASYADINLILGANDDLLDPHRHKLISTSSCNATALLPLLKLIDEHNMIESGSIVTVHPLLSHQKVLDNGCVGSADRGVKCNMEFGRSATQNIIPSQTTTIEACSYVVPRFNQAMIASSSLRVPTPTVGAINITLHLSHETNTEKILKLCADYASIQQYKIILNNHAPLVSSDFQAQEYTTIIDHRFTTVTQGKLLNMLVWYDNEWGYASKVVDIVGKFADR
jgi:glyceraldehyde 3-phosphate dehydrogenase